MNLRNMYICSVCGKTCIGALADKNKCCPHCHNMIIDTNIDSGEYSSIRAKDPEYDKMLLEKFVIPYGKYSPSENARSQIKIERNIAQSKSCINQPKCPTCQSTNVRKMGGVERGASIATFGIFSKKINKTFKCGNCGYTW